MRETVESYLVDEYLSDLSRELTVRGVEKSRRESVLAETREHLAESVGAVAPETAQEVRAVLRQFGDPKRMARQLAATYEQAGSKRRFLWPTLFFLPAYCLFMSGILWFRLFASKLGTGDPDGFVIAGHRFLASGINVATLFLLLCAAIFAWFGYRARRPLFGQFVASASLLTVVSLAWYAATCCPVGVPGSWYEPVSKGQIDRHIAQLRSDIVREGELVAQFQQGEKVFTRAGSPSAVPARLAPGGRFLTPEGLREITIGVPLGELNPSLRLDDWGEAVKAWTDTPYGSGISAAKSEIALSGRDVDFDRLQIAQAQWIRNQPLSTQVALDFHIAGIRIFALTGMAMGMTWIGWVLWLAVRTARRISRKLLYKHLAALEAR
ncbi:MAG TPA: hypothetical protein VMI31_12685 [Fimbriimonadaceae bacterium]|nr:hypothetical protein [Fimbriimonadaceae bacterium]